MDTKGGKLGGGGEMSWEIGVDLYAPYMYKIDK